MNSARLITRDGILTRVSAGDVDVYGNPTETTVNVPVKCEVQQQATTENNDVRGRVVTGWHAFFRAGTDVAAADRLSVDGLNYQVDGDPWPVRNARTGKISHVECLLEKTT